MEDGYKKFRQRLFQCSDTEWRLLSGSAYERPFFYGLTDVTDIDDLIWTLDICAFPPGKVVPENLRHRTKILTLHTEDVHPGFARLLITRDGRQEFYRTAEFYNEYMRDCGLFQIGLLPKGPAVQKLVKWFPNKIAACPHEDLCKFDKCWQTIKNIKVDVVKSVYCPYWPPEVEEWATRERPNGWPTSDDVKKIVGRGCHFVAKPHQSNPDDSTQWRFSFSQAEIILVSSWTDVQMYIYHVLRVIKSEVVKSSGGEDSTVLCTFYFKTLMFWACEEKRREFWNEENLENSVGELLCQMIEWLIERRCPNYFIPENNMIDYLSDDVDLSTEISALLYYRENSSQLMSRIPKAYGRGTVYEVSIPEKFRRIFQFHLIYAHLLNPLDPKMTDRFMEHLWNSNEILPELKYIYLGIASQGRLMNSPNEKLPRKSDAMLLSMATKYFDKAVGYKYEECGKMAFSFFDTLPTIFEKVMQTNDHVFLDERRSLGPAVDTNDEKNVNFSMFLEVMQCLMQQLNETLPEPCYFVAAACRANFLYSALRDYSSAARQCDEALELLDKYEDAIDDGNLFKSLRRFIVTNEIAVVFDEHVQVLVGFVALLRKIYRQRNSHVYGGSVSVRDVVFHLDASEFLRYIRHRCSLHLGHRVTAEFQRHVLGDLFRNKLFVEADTEKCSNLFLSTAIRISAIKPQ